MKILVCPDKFKGTLTAPEAAKAIGAALRKKHPDAEIILLPLADGGEGSLELIASSQTVNRHRLEVVGPLRKPVLAEYLLAPDGRAWIETSQACGLRHVPAPRRNPGKTTTIGVGQLIEDAIARGAHDVTMFLGGSATNDAGAGMAGALGYRFYSNRPDDFIPTGDALRWVQRIDAGEVLSGLEGVSFTAVCDVDNPLLGPTGATYTYAEQKGAKPADLASLETDMAHFAERLEALSGKQLHDLPGAGAAGGLAAGAVAFLNASLRPGVEVLFEAVGFEQALDGVDLVVTGEGHLDEQTLHGKVVSGVASRAKAAGVPRVVALCGRKSVSRPQLEAMGLDAAYAMLDRSSITLAEALYRPAETLDRLIGLVKV